jgi:riboflavin kinase / FMN adenylyltransferase
MLIFQGFFPSNPAPQGRAVTIGNFDGVHCGHQALIEKAQTLAETENLISTVVTFEPHPKAFFAPDQAPGKIQGLRGKAQAIASLGIDELCVLRFRKALASMSAEAFMQEFLCKALNAKHIVIGDDFRFGAKRRGDVAMLTNASAAYGWTVHSIHSVSLDGERTSSSRLRDALAAGDLSLAHRLMGRPYSLSGHVSHGRKLGRDIGFPTLNIAVHRALILSGVFVVSVHGVASQPIQGVASLGRRPTVENDGRLLLEVHLFDWSGDIYGKLVHVEFHEKLRNEQRYDVLSEMIAQIQLDAQAARDYFAHQHAH